MEQLQQPQSRGNRDQLVAKESVVKAKFKNAYDQDVDKLDITCETKKVMVTMPFPYCNGTVHAGHGFTMMQCDMYAQYHRLQPNTNVLLLSGIHATGTPIPAVAKKLKRELEDTDDTKPKPQTKIMIDMGIHPDELHKFTDPYYWLPYFQKEIMDDWEHLGVSLDFSRSFVTTDINPYFSAFVRWQFNVLRSKGYVYKSKRYAIFSPLDNQPCGDHERTFEGEGVEPKNYSLILLRLKEKFNDYDNVYDNVHLAVATLRPETMYGQTNVWINPATTYEMWRVDGKLIIAQPLTFVNLSYQNHILEDTKVKILGNDLCGLWVHAPLTRCGFENYIPVLPFECVISDVGTGVVTSVPSNSPTDYLGLKRFLSKPNADPKLEEIRLRYKDKDIFYPIIELNGEPFTSMKECEKLEATLNQKVKLEDIHHRVYRDEYHNGVFVVDGANTSVQKAQDDTKLILGDCVINYYEPEKPVYSRSGDRCVVALTDQWCINYGDPEIKAKAVKYLDTNMKLYTPESVAQFYDRLDWINEWACSRQFGLGTQLFDTEFKIDSLSDSTIYMAYYTISHLIEKIPLDKVNDDLFNFIFFKNKKFTGEFTDDETQLVLQMKREFNYWYPVDLRVSALDLVGNHLIMALLTHIMVWTDEPEKWIRGYSINGYLMLNGKKMSKSAGNFRTVKQLVSEYGADPVRFGLVDAGEGIHDANLTDPNMDQLVMRLTREREWCYELFETLKETPKKSQTIWEQILLNQTYITMTKIKDNYENMRLRRVGCDIYVLLNIRDQYREMVKSGLIKMCPDTMRQFVEYLLLAMYPITPHWVQDIWDQCDLHKIPMSRTWVNPPEGDSKYFWISDMIKTASNSVRSKITRERKILSRRGIDYSKDSSIVKVNFISRLSKPELDILDVVDNLLSKSHKWSEISTIVINTGDESKKKGLFGRFVSNIKENTEKYGIDWISYVYKPEEITRLCVEWLPIILGKEANLEFDLVEPTGKLQYTVMVGEIDVAIVSK